MRSDDRKTSSSFALRARSGSANFPATAASRESWLRKIRGAGPDLTRREEAVRLAGDFLGAWEDAGVRRR